MISSKQLLTDHPEQKPQDSTERRRPMPPHLRLRRNVLKDKEENTAGRRAHDARRQGRLVAKKQMTAASGNRPEEGDCQQCQQ